MGTAGGEPRVLLNALKPMLGVVGDIKTPQEVMRVVGMMKDAEKLMSRCIYLNILKATSKQAVKNTEKKETLHKFLSNGGWGILNKWLMEFTKSENFPVLLELIDVLKVLPITVDLLKQGNTGKIMKSMTKLEHAEVKKHAIGLIKQWKNMIRIREIKNKAASEEEAKAEENQEEQEEKTKRKLSLDPSKASDSSGFMNALNITPSPVKKKRRTSNDTNTNKATLPLDELLKDTPVEKPEENEKIEDVGSPERQENAVFVYHSPAVEAANAALAQDTADTVIIDEGSLARKKNKKKRNITWASDDKLVQVSYFELMEGEKKGGHAESFSQARQLELLLEKQAMRSVRREDRMVEKVEWKCLIPVDNAGVPGLIPGEKSKQKFIQAEREKSVLAYIFLSKQSLPDNPSEPDFNPDEHNRTHQATIIPHDEEQTVLPPCKVPTPKSTQKFTLKSTQQPTLSNITTTVQTKPNQSSSVSQTSQPPPAQNKPPNVMSTAVQNIMSHLQQQMNTSPTVPPPNVLPHMAPPHPPVQPGQPPFPLFPNTPNIPPPNIHPSNINQQVGGNNGFNPRPPMDQPVGLMDANIRGGGPRFPGGRGFNNNVPRDDSGNGGYNTAGGPGSRGRWTGPPNQAPPPNQRNAEWDDKNFHDGNNYNGNYNDGNFRGRGRGQNNFGNHRGEHRGGRGFRHGGDNFNRGRGVPNRGRGNDRGRGNNDRARGNNNRGRGNNDRGRGGNDNHGRYSANNDWSYDDNWNNHRNARNYGNDSSRERDHHHNRDNSRSHDDRSKVNKR